MAWIAWSLVSLATAVCWQDIKQMPFSDAREIPAGRTTALLQEVFR